MALTTLVCVWVSVCGVQAYILCKATPGPAMCLRGGLSDRMEGLSALAAVPVGAWARGQEVRKSTG